MRQPRPPGVTQQFSRTVITRVRGQATITCLFFCVSGATIEAAIRDHLRRSPRLPKHSRGRRLPLVLFIDRGMLASRQVVEVPEVMVASKQLNKNDLSR